MQTATSLKSNEFVVLHKYIKGVILLQVEWTGIPHCSMQYFRMVWVHKHHLCLTLIKGDNS